MKRDKCKIHMNIGTLGQKDHGKTTLSAAISLYCGMFYGYKIFTYDDCDNTVHRDDRRGITINTRHMEYQSETRHYAHIDCPGHVDYMKNMTTGAAQMDGVILVVSAAESLMPEVREQIKLAQRVGFKNVIVFLNKIDLVEDSYLLKSDLLKIAEEKIRDMLTSNGYSGNSIPIIRGSALKALEELEDKRCTEISDCIKELVDTMDSYFPDPVKDNEKPFLMAIEDVFDVPDRGVAVCGEIKHGIIRLNDNVEIVGMRGNKMSVVTCIEQFNKTLDKAQTVDIVGIFLQSIEKQDAQRGQVLAEPGSAKAYTKFKALVYCLSKDEGGRQSPIKVDEQFQFYFRTTDIKGKIILLSTLFKSPHGSSMCTQLERRQLLDDVWDIAMPGDVVEIVCELDIPVAMDKGLRFAIRENGRTVASGQVLEMLRNEEAGG